MRRFVRSGFLIVPLLIAFVLSGCLGSLRFSTNPGDSFTGGIPDQPKIVIPATDDQLPPHLQGELIVALKPGEAIDPIAEALGATVLGSLEPLHTYRLRLNDPDASITDAMRSLEHRPEVRYAEPNYADIHLDPIIEDFGAMELAAFLTGTLGPANTPTDTLIPNDPAFWTLQYGPQIIGAPEAWAAGYTGAGITIAILDTGVDDSHPDLAGRVLTGYYVVDENYDTHDHDGHGTHVAGIAAATTNNGIGISGIAGDAYIFPVKVFPTGMISTSTYNVAYGILVAAMPSIAGLPYGPADVINLSLGGETYSFLAQDAVQFAVEQNVVVVASAGNNYIRRVNYPAAYQGVIGVAATDPWDEKAYFSSSGSHVSVAAPGYAIYSTILDGEYARWSGTSMAAPHVAGAAALIRQKYPGMNPIQVRHLLEQSADAPNGYSMELGHGRINVSRALGLEVDFNRTTLRVTVKGSDGTPIPGADVLLVRNGAIVGNTRTGGHWELNGELLYHGVAIFYSLDPGSGYRLAIRLDEVFHGIDFLHVVEEIELADRPVNEIEVVLPVQYSG